MSAFNETPIVRAARAWLEGVGWRVVPGTCIAPETPGGAEPRDCGAVLRSRSSCRALETVTR